MEVKVLWINRDCGFDHLLHWICKNQIQCVCFNICYYYCPQTVINKSFLSLCISESFPVPGHPHPDHTTFEPHFRNIYSFIFVRHPFERLVSAYKVYKKSMDQETAKGIYTMLYAIICTRIQGCLWCPSFKRGKLLAAIYIAYTLHQFLVQFLVMFSSGNNDADEWRYRW